MFPDNIWGDFFIKPDKNTNNFFPPYAYLQFGPAPDQSIIMYFLYANYTNTDNPIVIFNPHSRIDNYLNATGILYKDTLQPSFDSFFLFNKLQPQVIPQISNISLQISSMLNVYARHVTQVDINDSITLNGDNSNYFPSYTIPTFIKPGFYLLQLNVYFPEYKIFGHYINTMYLNPKTNNSSDTLNDLLPDSNGSTNLSTASQSTTNSLGNNSSSYGNSMSY